MDLVLEIGTRIKVINIHENMTDIYGIENGDLGVIIGRGSEGYEYLIGFDELKEGSTTNIGCCLSKNEVQIV